MTAPAPIHKVSVAQKAANTVTRVQGKLYNRPIFITLILATGFLFVALLTFNYLAANPDMSRGLFHYGQAEVSKMYPVKITPAGWAFAIWGIIYLLQASWILYNLALLCRVSPNNEPAYLDPSVLSPSFLLFFNLSSIFNVGWLFIWDRLLFISGFVFLACIAIALYLTWAIAGHRLAIYKNYLIDQGRSLEVKFLYVAVINGIAMYATWSTIATLINLNVVLVYKSDSAVSSETASIIALAILAAIAVIYIGLDLSVLDRYTRFAITPYLVVVWATAAIIAQNWNPVETSSIMTAVICGVASLASLVKVALAVARGRSEMYQYHQMKMGASLQK